jgi:hypothetical protein
LQNVLTTSKHFNQWPDGNRSGYFNSLNSLFEKVYSQRRPCMGDDVYLTQAEFVLTGGGHFKYNPIARYLLTSSAKLYVGAFGDFNALLQKREPKLSEIRDKLYRLGEAHFNFMRQCVQVNNSLVNRSITYLGGVVQSTWRAAQVFIPFSGI